MVLLRSADRGRGWHAGAGAGGSAGFYLDLEGIEAAIVPRTRAIIVNSPNNPTGRVYPASTLAGLADVLTRASERNGRPIYLLSDEAYSRIIYDGAEFPG